MCKVKYRREKLAVAQLSVSLEQYKNMWIYFELWKHNIFKTILFKRKKKKQQIIIGDLPRYYIIFYSDRFPCQASVGALTQNDKNQSQAIWCICRVTIKQKSQVNK